MVRCPTCSNALRRVISITLDVSVNAVRHIELKEPSLYYCYYCRKLVVILDK